MWVDELCPDRAKDLILTILHHGQLTSIVDNTCLAHVNIATTSLLQVRTVSSKDTPVQ